MDTILLQKADNYLGTIGIAALKPFFYLLNKIRVTPAPPQVIGDFTFIKILGGGSLVIAFPALLGLRKKYPSKIFHLVTSQGVAPFARTLNIFDRIHIIDTNSPLSLAPSALRALKKAFHSGASINLEVYSKLATIFQALSFSRCRIGFFLHDKFWRSSLDTHLIFFNRFSGVYHFYDHIAHIFGATPEDPMACRARLLDHLAPLPAPFPPADIAIGHACSDMARERMLTPEQWKCLFQDKLRPDAACEVCFLGAAADHREADKIIRSVSPAFPQMKFRNYCGEFTLSQSLKLLAGAGEFWGVDSSLIHYARLLGVRSVSFWGPTDPMTRLRKISGLAEDVHYHKVPCSPCVHIAEYPPCRGNNMCMQRHFHRGGEEEYGWSIPWWTSEG